MVWVEWLGSFLVFLLIENGSLIWKFMCWALTQWHKLLCECQNWNQKKKCYFNETQVPIFLLDWKMAFSEPWFTCEAIKIINSLTVLHSSVWKFSENCIYQWSVSSLYYWSVCFMSYHFLSFPFKILKHSNIREDKYLSPHT